MVYEIVLDLFFTIILGFVTIVSYLLLKRALNLITRKLEYKLTIFKVDDKKNDKAGKNK